jgi:hypothetical protein
VDHIDFAEYSPVNVSVTNSSFGRVGAVTPSGGQALVNNRITDLVLFDISGNSGDTFSIECWQFANQASVTATGMLTFDLL